MRNRNSTAVAAAVVGLVTCLSITTRKADASPMSWGHAGMTAGTADLIPADLIPTASDSAATNPLLASESTGSSVLLTHTPPEQQGLLGTFGYLQDMFSPGRVILNGAELMPLYELSVQDQGVDPRSEYEWQEANVGIDALQALAFGNR